MQTAIRNRTISRHIITSGNNLGFSAVNYSKFKYGSKDVARRFGKELGAYLISQGYFDTTSDKQIVIIPSPYYFIPTATYAMKDYLIHTINNHLVKIGQNPVQEAKIWRKPAYVTDYGDMSEIERKAAIGSESFHLDRDFVKGKHLMFLDDIRITGAHEERIKEMIERLQLEENGCSCDFIYYALLNNRNVDPKLESQLNLAALNNLLDLDKIVKNENFLFNTRNVKYILASPPDECKVFLNYQRKTFLETLHYNAIGNGYHLADVFKENLSILEELLKL
jgi:hypothetical protein